jgi:hypothetical protein
MLKIDHSGIWRHHRDQQMVGRVGVPNLSHCVAAKGGAIEYGLNCS